jgi:hypothetical protein
MRCVPLDLVHIQRCVTTVSAQGMLATLIYSDHDPRALAVLGLKGKILALAGGLWDVT